MWEFDRPEVTLWNRQDVEIQLLTKHLDHVTEKSQKWNVPSTTDDWNYLTLRCRQKSPSDETINRSPPCVYACKKITYTRQGSCSPCLMDYGNTKTTQQALNVSESSTCWRWKRRSAVSRLPGFSLTLVSPVLLTDQSKVPRRAQIWLVVLLHVHRNRRLIGDRSPGWPPRLSHSSWALLPKLLSRRN